MTDQLHEYLLSSSIRESDLLRRLREETAKDELSRMQISPEQGQFMSFLLRMMGARQALEIGVFTGYSSICIAEALGPRGHLLACDIDEKYTAVARRYWKEAGIESRIDLKIGPALETLTNLRNDVNAREAIDFIFIDADKENLPDYYELSMQLIRPGGIIAVDNVLWGGRVADSSVVDPETQAIRRLNERMKTDDRIFMSLVPIGDGLGLALKK